VRYRTDGERELLQTAAKSRGASHSAFALLNGVAVEIGFALDAVSASPSWQWVQPPTGKPGNEKVHSMLYTIAVVLLVMWVLGLVSSYTMGGFIHILLVVAVVMVLVNLISGRRA
jgi:hypothetical protein